MDDIHDFAYELKQKGQVAKLEELQSLVFAFEQVLERQGISIKSGSGLESACCSVLEVLSKNQNKDIRQPDEDIRLVYSEVLGIWMFLQKVVRLEKHVSFQNFVPHLELLNKGTVTQNKRLGACEDASNKIFELLFALVLLDISNDVILAHPDFEDTSNPDILATIDGQRWGFACKVLYGTSGKALYGNLKKGVEQIQESAASIGCVMVNFRNVLKHEIFWPVVNEVEWRKGAEPVFAAYFEPGKVAMPKISKVVTDKRDDVVKEIEYQNVINLFAGKKAIPGFLAFCQTVSGKISPTGAIPTSLTSLVLANFSDLQPYIPIFEKMNIALHERSAF